MSARGLLQRAADVSTGSLHSRALFELSRSLFDLKDFQGGADAAETAIAVAEENEDHEYALRSRLIRAEVMAQIDPSYTINATLAESAAALDELQRLGDAAGIRQAKLAIARTEFYLGNAGASHAIVEELRDDAADRSFVERREIVTIIAHVAATSDPRGPMPRST